MSELFPIERLEKIQNDRGKMACLRRWWSPATRHYAYPVIGRIFGGHCIGRTEIEIPAALYAIHPKHSNDLVNIGDTCRLIAGPDLDSFEARFRKILACQQIDGDLDQQIYRVGRLAHSKAVKINFVQLSEDLSKWKWRHRDIKVLWSRRFWKEPEAENLNIPQTHS